MWKRSPLLWLCALLLLCGSAVETSLSLHDASEKGNVTEVLQLLSEGVPIDLPLGLDMKTPLMSAVARRRPAVVRALLQAGASVHMQDAHGATALQHACGAGLTESVTMLLRAGADSNTRDTQGLSALHRAAERGHVAVAQELLAHGANPNLASRNCVSAFHLASTNCHGGVASVLHRAGAYTNYLPRLPSGLPQVEEKKRRCPAGSMPELAEIPIGPTSRCAQPISPVDLPLASLQYLSGQMQAGIHPRELLRDLMTAGKERHLGRPDEGDGAKPPANARPRAPRPKPNDQPRTNGRPEARADGRAAAAVEEPAVGSAAAGEAAAKAADASGSEPAGQSDEKYEAWGQSIFKAMALMNSFFAAHPEPGKLASNLFRFNALQVAASHGDARAVRGLISLGATLDARDMDGTTALHLASSSGQVRR